MKIRKFKKDIPYIIIILILLTFIMFNNNFWKQENVNKEEKNQIKSNVDSEKIEPVKLTSKEIIEIVSKNLKQWTNYYIEDIQWKNSLKLLKDADDWFYKFYYIWYANEIMKSYDLALKNYDLALNLENIKPNEKALAINQKWHIYDLMWDMEKANSFYLLAEEIDSNFIWANINRWRYEARKWNMEEAEKYFKKHLEEEINSFIKAELYFNLSTIYQTKDLDIAIEFAEKGIEVQKNYPNNYLSLWISYIMYWWEDLDKVSINLEKSLSLNQNSSLTYKYLGIYKYIIDDYKSAIENFKLQKEKAKNDIMLMANDKIKIEKEATYDLAKTYALNNDSYNSIKYLNEVLNGENKNYYFSFLRDISNENSPFEKIKENEMFTQNFTKILNLYK